MIRLLIIEKHTDVRNALAFRLGSSPTIEVIAIAKNLEEGTVLDRELEPDVILLGLQRNTHEDVRRFYLDMIEFLKQGRPVIILASIADVVERQKLLQYGAKCYLLKDINTPKLIERIEFLFRENEG